MIPFGGKKQNRKGHRGRGLPFGFTTALTVVFLTVMISYFNKQNRRGHRDRGLLFGFTTAVILVFLIMM
jgi:hypothetical protein